MLTVSAIKVKFPMCTPLRHMGIWRFSSTHS